MRLYVGLVHYPVYNKHEETIASAITPLDIHDFARLGKTYDVSGFFVITPLEDQQSLVFRILRHWTRGYGATYNRHRKEAMDLVSVTPSLEAAIENVLKKEREEPRIVATDAVLRENRSMGYGPLRNLILSNELIMLLFGTAWGLHKGLLRKADSILEPIFGRSDYNHLSVRTAAAIILDRLVGRSAS